MLRDAGLIPLSRQHQHALALCVRIDRALRKEVVDLRVWQEEINQSFEQEIKGHFASEEEVLFPAARSFPELPLLVDELLGEHRRLREHFSRAGKRTMDQAELGAFAKLLSGHIRKEERLLFEALQKLMSEKELAALGKALQLADQGNASCWRGAN